MKLDYAILADGVSQRNDGKIDIFGAAWDTIFATSVPVLHNRLTLATRIFISRNESETAHSLDLILQSADGGELARAAAKIDPLPVESRNALPGGRPFGLNVVLNFDNVVFPNFGDYQLAVLCDGTELKALQLRVEQKPGEEEPLVLPPDF